MKRRKSQEPGLLIGDLFSGAGGLAEGFRQAGFRSVFSNDFDEASCDTFQLNFPEAVVFRGPIQDLSAREILRETGLERGELDVLVGGPPCQGFSINAPLRTTTDPRNHLFRHYIRLVLEGLRPKAIVFENVPGLITMGQSLHDVLQAFGEAGYRVSYKVLNAAHYGVPEERWRLVLVGTRLERQIAIPEPLHYSRARANFSGGRHHTFSYAVGAPDECLLQEFALSEPVSVGDAIGDLPPLSNGGGDELAPYASSPTTVYQKYAREDAGDTLFNHRCARLSEINLQRMAHVAPGGSWRDIPYELLPEGMKRARRSDHTRRYGRLDPDALSGTVLTKCDPHWGTFVHYRDTRIISVREAARIQSFPDRFRFSGSLTEQYRQVGNAVPPLLARAIAERISDALRLES